jgi:hypothetical protein
MRQYLILLLLIMSIILPRNPHSTAQDAVSPAPYVYYFSEAERGIVIERADSTDRHLIDTAFCASRHFGDAGWLFIKAAACYNQADSTLLGSI